MQTVLAWGMVAFGLLLIYDFISLGIRVGFGRRYASALFLGIAVCAVYGIQLSGWGLPAFCAAFLSVAALVFLAGFAGYLIGTVLCVARPPRRNWRYVVVLGAALRQRRNPSPLLKSRLEVGRLWWHMPFPCDAGKARRLTHIASESPMPGAEQVALPAAGAAASCERFIVTSGGQGPDEDVPEARAMRDYLVARGVPADRIMMEPHSSTTWENLANARTLIADCEAQQGAAGVSATASAPDGRERAATDSAEPDGGLAQTESRGTRAKRMATSVTRRSGKAPHTALQAYAESQAVARTHTARREGKRASSRAYDAETSEMGACLIVTNDFHAFRTWVWAHRLHLPVAGVIGKPTRLYYLVGSLPRDYLALLKGYKTEVVAVAAFLLAVCLLALL